MLIREFGFRSAVTVSPFASTDVAIDLMWRHESRYLLVTDRTGLAGLVTDADLLESVAMLTREERLSIGRSISQEEVIVADVMDAHCACMQLDDLVTDAAHRLVHDHTRMALPVVEGSELRGVVTAEDLLQLFAGSCWLDRETPHRQPVMHYASRILRSVRPDDTLSVACARLSGARTRHLVVAEGDRFLGLLSDADIRLAIGEKGVNAWPSAPAREYMNTKIQTLRPRDTLLCAAEVMRLEKLIAAPITTREGELLGVITVSDVLRALAGSTPVHV
jgi:CBS domain-containing protein